MKQSLKTIVMIFACSLLGCCNAPQMQSNMVPDEQAEPTLDIVKASENGNYNLVCTIVAKGIAKDIVNTKSPTGMTPLIAAAFKGHERVVALLLRQGAKANAQDATGNNALLYAAREGHWKVMRLLLLSTDNVGIYDVDAQDERGKTAYEYAKSAEQSAEQEEIVRGLKHIMLIKASCKGELGKVKLLVSEKTRDEQVYTQFYKKLISSNITPLMAACSCNKLDVVHYLVEQGANLDIEAQNGGTALLHASYHSNWEVMSVLLQNGFTNVNAQWDSGDTALFYVAHAGHLELVQHLLKKGADVNIENKKRKKASYYASRHYTVSKLLLQCEQQQALSAISQYEL